MMLFLLLKMTYRLFDTYILIGRKISAFVGAHSWADVMRSIDGKELNQPPPKIPAMSLSL
jgi:hypothetical protein